MTNTKYKLRYLPIFYEDLEQKALYIMSHLENPKAANDLIDAVEKAILERLPIAESFEPYHSLSERKYPYYRIYVKNFVVYYVVINDEVEDKIMEVQKFAPEWMLKWEWKIKLHYSFMGKQYKSFEPRRPRRWSFITL